MYGNISMKTLLMMMLFASCSNLFAAQNTKALEVKEHKLKNGLNSLAE